MTFGLSLSALSVPNPARAADSVAPPLVTMAMSRTEVSAADWSTGEGDTCVRDDRNIATLGGVVLPWITANAPRVHLVGSVETGFTSEVAEWCSHHGWTRSASWSEMVGFQTLYGMRFIDHSATYPLSWTGLSPQRRWDETCGSRDAINAHGLLGADGQFDWPNNTLDAGVETTYVLPCFYFGRRYGSGVTTLDWAATHNHEASTRGINGGSCTAIGQPCSTADGSLRYVPPTKIIAAIKSLLPGQALNLQAYLLVKGKNPQYSATASRVNTTQWNCNSTNVSYHWSNDVERYCWNDFKTILSFLQHDPNVHVTDFDGVATAWGMPRLPPEPPRPAP
jgi:hypothetical protein